MNKWSQQKLINHVILLKEMKNAKTRNQNQMYVQMSWIHHINQFLRKSVEIRHFMEYLNI